MTFLLKAIIVCLGVLVFTQSALYIKAAQGKNAKSDDTYTYVIMALSGVGILAGVFLFGKQAYNDLSRIKYGVKARLDI